jgi:hypothetical protein
MTGRWFSVPGKRHCRRTDALDEMNWARTDFELGSLCSGKPARRGYTGRCSGVEAINATK